jgi:hypothetical protein
VKKLGKALLVLAWGLGTYFVASSLIAPDTGKPRKRARTVRHILRRISITVHLFTGKPRFGLHKARFTRGNCGVRNPPNHSLLRIFSV